MTASRTGFPAAFGVALVALFGASPALAETTSVSFTSDSSWTVPYGVTSVDVLVVGGGGSGGGGPALTVNISGGGGGGGQVKVCAGVPVSEGGVLSVVVGQGGSGGSGASLVPAPSGGSSSLTAPGSSPCTAAGGLGGVTNFLSLPTPTPGDGAGGASGSGQAGGQGSGSISGFQTGAGGGGGAGGSGANGSGGSAGGSSCGDPSPPIIAGAGGQGASPADAPVPGLFADYSTRLGGGGGGGVFTDSLGGTPGQGVDGGGNGGGVRINAAVTPNTCTGVPSTDGAPGTGGGGGGGGETGDSVGRAGGSGLVEIRFLTPPPKPSPDPGPTPGPTPGPAPSNAFSVRSSRVTGAVITTVVRVPGAGRTVQRGRAGGVKGAVCSPSKSSRKAGTVTLRCRVAARALRRCGSSVRVALTTTFTPAGGTARSKVRVVSIRKRCPTPRFTG